MSKTKDKEWEAILDDIAGFPVKPQLKKEELIIQKDMFAKQDKPAPKKLPTTLPKKEMPSKNKKQKTIPEEKLNITTARIIEEKLRLIKFVHNDLNAFEALDQVVDFWIENKQTDIEKATNRMMGIVENFSKESSPTLPKKEIPTESKKQEPIPKEKLKITTARIIDKKLRLIKFVHSDLNAFEALNQVVDFWIQNKKTDIKKATDRMMGILEGLSK